MRARDENIAGATYRDFRRGTSLNEFSRRLRQESTDAERVLWNHLRSRQVAGAKFRRQHEYGRFILDFFCAEHRLVIEVDGGQHNSDDREARDRERTAFLSTRGLRVIRFSNTEVLEELDGVVQEIRRVLGECSD